MITTSPTTRCENSFLECIIPSADELNYETSQVQCPHRNEESSAEKCQKLFKKIKIILKKVLKIKNYIKNVYLEMKKVSWPARNEIFGSTAVVIVISLFVAFIIFILDRLFTVLLGIIIK